MLTDLDRLHTRLFLLLVALVVALLTLLTASGSWSRESGSVVGALVSSPPRPGSRHPRPVPILRQKSDGELRVLSDWDSPHYSEFDTVGNAWLWHRTGTTGFWVGSQQWVWLAIRLSSIEGDFTREEELRLRRQVRDLRVAEWGSGISAADAARMQRLATEDVRDAWFTPIGAALELIASILAISIVVVGANWVLVAVRVARMPRGIAGRRPLREICGRCGYDVRGLSVCPECGNGRRRGNPMRRES